MKILAASICILILLAPAVGQEHPGVSSKLLTPKPTPPLELEISSSKKTDVPPFAYYDLFQTDADQNLYVHVDRGSVNDAVVMRLQHDDMDPTLFTAPPEIANKTHFRRFFVTPGGKVSMLLQSNSHQGIWVLPFASDGSAQSPIELDLDHSAFAQDFAVFESGPIVVAGFYGEQAPGDLKAKSFVSLFDGSGKLEKSLRQALPGVDLSSVHTKPHAGATAMGPDGNLYLLREKEILVVSAGGKVLRRIPFDVPEVDFSARQLFVSAGYIAVSLYRPRKKGIDELQLLVLNADKGEVFRLYRVPEPLENVVIGFSRSEGFTFLSLDPSSHHFNLVTTALR